jgi:TldD protein
MLDHRARSRSALALLLCCAAAGGCGGGAPSAERSDARDAATRRFGPAAPKRLELVPAATKGEATAAPMLEVLRAELGRSVKDLSVRAKPAPYHLAYQAVEQHGFSAQASLGDLVESGDTHSRILDVGVRVGSHALDNTHLIRGHWDPSRHYSRSAWLPLDDDPVALAREIWLTTHAEYERAVEELMFVRANRDVKVTEEDTSDDFSVEAPVRHLEPLAALEVDRAAWEQRLGTHSRTLAQDANIHYSVVQLEASAENRFQATSDGSLVQTSRTWARLFLSASTTAPDGMDLSRTEILDATTARELPGIEEVERVALKVTADVLALRAAPVVEPYTGPAILDGKAAGVFFHEIFGHRVEGHRQKNAEEGQTFANKIGQPIMPGFLDVYDDPTVRHLNGVPLNGHYLVDDEAVPAARARLVESGILREFLMSRSPTRGFVQSNGHGRRQSGHRVVARQGNLIVDPARVTTPAALKQLLIEETRRQGKPFGLRFTEITGGYTTTTTDGAQAFKVLPVMVYRVFPDGSEELVRGVDLEGTPLTVLSRIVAAANDFQVFNGMCGAESGWVPVSATSPSLLVSQIEIARRERGHDRPPILPAPRGAAGSPAARPSAASASPGPLVPSPPAR